MSATVAAPRMMPGYAPKDLIARDIDATRRTVEQWFASRGVPDPRISGLSHPIGAGMSNETLLFTLADADNGERGLVLRIAPDSYQLFMDTRFGAQCTLLKALARGHHVRVPQILWEEEDRTVLGQRFFVMQRLNGWVPVSQPPYNSAGRLFDATPRERERLWQNALLELTRIHTVPLDEVAFLRRDPTSGLSGLAETFAHELEAYEWARQRRDVPFLEEAREWLTANLPANAAEGLSWGDARIGNMMFDDAFNLLAVFDWEQCSLAGPEQDLGWWLLFDELYSKSIGLERLDGLGDRASTIAAWQALTGLKPVNLLWHEYFSAFRLATIILRKSSLERLSTPGSNIGNNMFTRIMAKLRDMAPPADILEQDFPAPLPGR